MQAKMNHDIISAPSLGYLLQGFEPLRQQGHVRLIDGSHWNGG